MVLIILSPISRGSLVKRSFITTFTVILGPACCWPFKKLLRSWFVSAGTTRSPGARTAGNWSLLPMPGTESIPVARGTPAIFAILAAVAVPTRAAMAKLNGGGAEAKAF